jgi:hypothetical protein
MMKLGMDRGTLSGYGTIVELGLGGFLLATDLLPDKSSVVCRHMRSPLILFGTESWNRHFTMSAHILRITACDQLACSIGATTSDEFLRAWILRDSKGGHK